MTSNPTEVTAARPFDTAVDRYASNMRAAGLDVTVTQIAPGQVRISAHPRLTPPQLELLTDIATKPRMYLRRFSRWERTGHVLVRHGLAVMTDCGYEHSTITITPAGLIEAARRGLVPGPGNTEGGDAAKPAYDLVGATQLCKHVGRQIGIRLDTWERITAVSDPDPGGAITLTLGRGRTELVHVEGEDFPVRDAPPPE